MMDKKIITLFIFFILFSSIIIPYGSGKNTSEPRNPYGEGRFKLCGENMIVIYKNNSKLETKLFQYDASGAAYNLVINVLSENKSWSKVKIDFKEKGEELPINKTSLIFNVRKSNNIAYENRTGTCIGFFPFFVYHYLDNSFLDGEWSKEITLDKKYEASFTSQTLIGYEKTRRIHKEDMINQSNEVDLHEKINIGSALKFESKKTITYTKRRYETVTDKIYNTNQTRNVLHMGARGHYPIAIKSMLPAEIFFENITNQEYVLIRCNLGADQLEAVNFIKKIDIGGKPGSESSLIPVVILVGIVSAGSIVGFLAYKKKR